MERKRERERKSSEMGLDWKRSGRRERRATGGRESERRGIIEREKGDGKGEIRMEILNEYFGEYVVIFFQRSSRMKVGENEREARESGMSEMSLGVVSERKLASCYVRSLFPENPTIPRENSAISTISKLTNRKNIYTVSRI